MRARDLFEEARPNLRDMAEDLEDQGWTVTDPAGTGMAVMASRDGRNVRVIRSSRDGSSRWWWWSAFGFGDFTGDPDDPFVQGWRYNDPVTAFNVAARASALIVGIARMVGADPIIRTDMRIDMVNRMEEHLRTRLDTFTKIRSRLSIGRFNPHSGVVWSPLPLEDRMTIELMGTGWTSAQLVSSHGDPTNFTTIDDVIDAALLDGWPPA